MGQSIFLIQLTVQRIIPNQVLHWGPESLSLRHVGGALRVPSHCSTALLPAPLLRWELMNLRVLFLLTRSVGCCRGASDMHTVPAVVFDKVVCASAISITTVRFA